MPRKAKTKSSAKSPVKATKLEFDGKEITKGQQRKLNALRKSVGDKLGEKTFAEWLKTNRAATDSMPKDKNAALIAETLIKLIDDNKLRIPRGGYVVTRGRGRVVVTRTQGE